MFSALLISIAAKCGLFFGEIRHFLEKICDLFLKRCDIFREKSDVFWEKSDVFWGKSDIFLERSDLSPKRSHIDLRERLSVAFCANVFVKPNEQNRACWSYAMARKRRMKSNFLGVMGGIAKWEMAFSLNFSLARVRKDKSYMVFAVTSVTVYM